MKYHIASWAVPIPPSKNIGSKALFQIQSLKEAKKQLSNNEAAAYRSELFTLIWVKQGSGTYIADFESLAISEDTVYYIKPGQVLIFETDEQAEGYVIRFSPSFLCMYEETAHKLSNSGLFNAFSRALVIPVNADNEMNMLAEKMLAEYNNQPAALNEILPELLKVFLLYLNRRFEQNNRHYNQPGNTILVKKFFTLLEKNYITCKMVTSYAKELSVTPNYLNELIKKSTGFSARHHIQQRVVLEAKRKAVYAQMTMKEVAYNLGFEDIYHFSKYFKNVSGINFTTFKKEISGQINFM